MTQLLAIATALLALAGLGYVLWRPHWAVLLIIVLFPLEQLLQSYIPWLLAHPKVINYAVGFTALFALFSRFQRDPDSLQDFKNPLTALVCGLFGIVLIGLLYTPSDQAVMMLRWGLPYHGLLLVLMPLLIRDVREFNRLLTGVIVLGTVIAVMVFLNPRTSFASGRMTLDLSMFGESYRGNPLAMGTMGGMLALAAVMVRFERASHLLVTLRVAAFLMGMGLAIGSGSRGQVIAAIATGVLCYPLARHVRNIQQFFALAFGMMILLGGIYLSFKLFIGEENVTRWDPASMIERLGANMVRINDLLGAWLASPVHWLFGLGPNAFSAVGRGAYVHNFPAEVLGEEGLVGLILVCGMAFLVLRHSRRITHMYEGDPILRSAGAVLVAYCLFTFILALKQGSFIQSAAHLAWWMVLAKIATREQRTLQEADAIQQWEQQQYDAEDDEDLAMAGYGHT